MLKTTPVFLFLMTVFLSKVLNDFVVSADKEVVY
jgi:hypothetical protein